MQTCLLTGIASASFTPDLGYASLTRITSGQSNTAVKSQALALLSISRSDSKHLIINTAYILSTTVCASLELLYKGADAWLKEADVIYKTPLLYIKILKIKGPLHSLLPALEAPLYSGSICLQA